LENEQTLKKVRLSVWWVYVKKHGRKEGRERRKKDKDQELKET
jgi:hypothetical protein